MLIPSVHVLLRGVKVHTAAIMYATPTYPIVLPSHTGYAHGGELHRAASSAARSAIATIRRWLARHGSTYMVRHGFCIPHAEGQRWKWDVAYYTAMVQDLKLRYQHPLDAWAIQALLAELANRAIRLDQLITSVSAPNGESDDDEEEKRTVQFNVYLMIGVARSCYKGPYNPSYHYATFHPRHAGTTATAAGRQWLRP